MRRLACRFIIVLCALTAGLIAQSAHADSVTLRIMLWGQPGTEAPRRPQEPLVARYMPDQGGGFILDRSANPPLLRFEDSQEIWILQPQPGPRGDTIYRNDIGQPVLRATKLGGLTLFTADNPEGAAAAFDGEASTLRPPLFMSANVLFQHLIQASARSSHAAQRVISFQTVDDATPETAALVADTATATAEAINRVSRMPNGKVALARVMKVLLAQGHKPNAQLSSGALTVIYAPSIGVSGRPSSERIIRIITK